MSAAPGDAFRSGPAFAMGFAFRAVIVTVSALAAPSASVTVSVKMRVSLTLGAVGMMKRRVWSGPPTCGVKEMVPV